MIKAAELSLYARFGLVLLNEFLAVEGVVCRSTGTLAMGPAVGNISVQL